MGPLRGCLGVKAVPGESWRRRMSPPGQRSYSAHQEPAVVRARMQRTCKQVSLAQECRVGIRSSCGKDSGRWKPESGIKSFVSHLLLSKATGGPWEGFEQGAICSDESFIVSLQRWCIEWDWDGGEGRRY